MTAVFPISDSQAYAEGVEAATVGETVACPYPPNSRASMKWFDGYDDGTHDTSLVLAQLDDE